MLEFPRSHFPNCCFCACPVCERARLANSPDPMNPAQVAAAAAHFERCWAREYQSNPIQGDRPC